MGRFLESLRCCLNPKVIGGIAAAGLLVWLVAPASGAAALPLLFALICPLSMGVMAWQMMRRGRRYTTPESLPAVGAATTTAKVDAELRALREEIAIVRARRQLASRDEHPLG